MPNPLDPIWAALKVVRRCVKVEEIDRAKTFSNTLFRDLTDAQCIDSLDDAVTEVNDSAVLLMYATFEARLRDHIAKQAHHLQAVQEPNPDFGVALAASFSEYSDRTRMDDLAELFLSAVGGDLLAQVGNIRTYRHWLAHGRRGDQPPSVTPGFAYKTLTAFLQSAGLT